MYYILALLLANLAIALGSSFTLWGGIGQFLPAIMILTCATKRWRLGLSCLAALGFIGYFAPYSLWYFTVLVLTSLASYVVFERWVDSENSLVSFCVTFLLCASFICALYYPTHAPWQTYLGSLFLTLPLVMMSFLAGGWNKRPINKV